MITKKLLLKHLFKSYFGLFYTNIHFFRQSRPIRGKHSSRASQQIVLWHQRLITRLQHSVFIREVCLLSWHFFLDSAELLSLLLQKHFIVSVKGTINWNYYTATGKLRCFVLTQSDAVYHSIFLISMWLFCILTHIFVLDICYVSFLPYPKGRNILSCV